MSLMLLRPAVVSTVAEPGKQLPLPGGGGEGGGGGGEGETAATVASGGGGELYVQAVWKEVPVVTPAMATASALVAVQATQLLQLVDADVE